MAVPDNVKNPSLYSKAKSKAKHETNVKAAENFAKKQMNTEAE